MEREKEKDKNFTRKKKRVWPRNRSKCQSKE